MADIPYPTLQPQQAAIELECEYRRDGHTLAKACSSGRQASAGNGLERQRAVIAIFSFIVATPRFQVYASQYAPKLRVPFIMIPISLDPLGGLWVSLVLIFLFPSKALAQGKLALFLDFYCKTPSQLQPTVSLPLSTCLVPVGALSVAINQFPACDSGTASMIMYEDTSCARSTFDKTKSYTGYSDLANCFYLFVGKSIPGIMFTCEEPATNPQPTSTASITASAIAGVATGQGGGAKTTTASTTSSSPPPSKTSSPNTGGDGGGSGNPSDGSSTTSSAGGKPSGDASDSDSSSLSRSDKIAIGVGLGVGLPSVVVGILAWWWPRQKPKKAVST